VKIIPEWRSAWRLASVQALFLLQFLPDVVQIFMHYDPTTGELVVYRVALVIALGARFIHQPKVRRINGNS
jgi:nitroreductase